MKELTKEQLNNISDSYLEQSYGKVLIKTSMLVVRGLVIGEDYVEIFVHQIVNGVEKEREKYRRGQSVMRTHGGPHGYARRNIIR